jgi:hypothetical protein
MKTETKTKPGTKTNIKTGPKDAMHKAKTKTTVTVDYGPTNQAEDKNLSLSSLTIKIFYYY